MIVLLKRINVHPPLFSDISLPTGIKMFALKNSRRRLFVPGKENYIGGFKYENMMFDSGCTTILAPFPAQYGFHEFYDEYRNFLWSITQSSGVGSSSAPILGVTAVAEDDAKLIHLHTQTETAKITQVRFFLSVIDAQMILNHSHISQDVKNRLSEDGINQLKTYVKTKKILAEGPDTVRFGEARSYVLLGQQIFEGHFLLQTQYASLVIKPNDFAFRNVTVVFDQQFLQRRQTVNVNFPEFAMLEDADHVSAGPEEIFDYGPEIDDSCV